MEFQSYEANNTNITSTTVLYVGSLYKLSQEDSSWIVSNAFIIFTMQTGFGMLESGCVSLKNEVNIMMKNVVDIVLGGLTYWLFGFGVSFGREEPTNSFIGVGGYLIDPEIDDELFGPISAAFLFQLSFATTSTTIVSGAMAERCNFKAYCLFSLLNTIVYCMPAGWVWGDHGFLRNMGAVDIAGSGTVHLVGGVSGGGWYLLGVQLLTGVCLSVWSFTSSVILLWIIDKIIPIRMDEHEELLGADLVEHRIHHSQIGVSRALSALHPLPSKKQSLNGVPSIGTNPGHDSFILKVIRVKRLNNGLKIFHRRPLIRMENTFEEKLQIPTINSSNSDSLKLAWTN